MLVLHSVGRQSHLSGTAHHAPVLRLQCGTISCIHMHGYGCNIYMCSLTARDVQTADKNTWQSDPFLQ